MPDVHDEPAHGVANSPVLSPSTSEGLLSNPSPSNWRQRSLQMFPTGTWEGRVHRKCDELRRLFQLPVTEAPVEDFHCALQKKICLQGRLYLFQHHVCFYSNLFGFVKAKVIPLKDVTAISKRKNIGLPNSIEIAWSSNNTEKQDFFTSFLHRREAYKLMMAAWAQCSPLARRQMAESTSASRSSPGSSFTDRRGSIASCASLPDVHSLPHHEDVLTPLSRQASDAQSSCLDATMAKVDKQAVTEPPSSAGSRSSLRHNRAYSWGPSSEMNAVLASPFASPSNQQQSSKTIPAFGGPRESDDGAIELDEGDDQFGAEGGAAPLAPLGTTQLLDSVLHVSLHDFCHKFLADEAVFWQEFHESRGDKQVQLSSWTRHAALGHVRDLRFVSPVKAVIGPPQADCHQSQRYRMYKEHHLVLETSQTMSNIPFGDHFTVEVRWDVTQISASPSQCRVKSQVHVPFSKSTWWKKAIQKGSIDSCREAHEDWLAKVQASLAAPAHVLQGPTASNLSAQYQSTNSAYCEATQGEVDELLQRLPREHRESVASVISRASQGSLCASSPRSMKSGLLLSEDGHLLNKQASQGISRMSKTTRFADMLAQQELPHTALSQSLSGVPAGAHWMANRLVLIPDLGSLLIFLALVIVLLQVMILVGRGFTTMVGPVVTTPSSQNVHQLHQDLTALKQQLSALQQAVAAHGIQF